MDLTVIILIIGIFVATAFFMIGMILRQKHLGMGYWPLFAFAILFLTMGEFVRSILDNTFGFEFFFIISMILFGFAAFLKFWDIMRLIE